MFGVVKGDGGYMIAICNKNGVAKSIAEWFTADTKKEIIAKIKAEQ
ncbi:MAG: hypothetical protein WAM14_24440 [Candidatus Nitrosopolaris sp.]